MAAKTNQVSSVCMDLIKKLDDFKKEVEEIQQLFEREKIPCDHFPPCYSSMRNIVVHLRFVLTKAVEMEDGAGMEVLPAARIEAKK